MSSYEATELLKLAEELRLAIEREDAQATVWKLYEISCAWDESFGYAEGKEHVGKLNVEDQELLERRFGLNGRDEEDLESLAQHIPGPMGGDSRENVRQRIKVALGRLRKLV